MAERRFNIGDRVRSTYVDKEYTVVGYDPIHPDGGPHREAVVLVCDADVKVRHGARYRHDWEENLRLIPVRETIGTMYDGSTLYRVTEYQRDKHYFGRNNGVEYIYVGKMEREHIFRIVTHDGPSDYLSHYADGIAQTIIGEKE